MDHLIKRKSRLEAFSSALAILVPLLAIIWVLGLPQRFGIMIFPEQMVGLMLGLSVAVCYLKCAQDPKSRFPKWDLVLALASLAMGLHVFLRFQTLSEGAFRHPIEAMALGIVVSLLIMEGVRRLIGYTLVVIFGLLVVYAVAGSYVPGALRGRNQPFDDVLRYIGTDSSATWGQSLQIAAFVVVLFVLFGSFLMGTGGSEFFSNLAARVSGKGPGGSAKVAVTASALTGMISGSAVSNVMTTGVITIPVMRKSGFSATNASAIEAVASTGGQLMPPIMGAAAFLMAEMLRVPYKEIVIAATLPALLYFISIYIQIDFMSRRDKMTGDAGFEKRPLAEIFLQGWGSVAAIIVLMGAIFFFGMSAESAVVYATLASLVIALGAWVCGSKYGAMSPQKIVAALIDAGKSTCDVLLICAAAGIIIGLMTLTGLGFTLSYYLMNFGSDNMFTLLLLSAVIGLVLGLGLPTTAVYLLMATLAAPALVELGIPPMAAHMFLLYYGMLSIITPPIAIAAYAAASIGGADQHQTGMAAFRFGWVSYILPFYFIYKPGLLLETSYLQSAYVFGSTIVSLSLIAAAVLGYAHRSLSPLERAFWLILGAAVIYPLDQISSVWVEYAVSAVALVVLIQHIAACRSLPALAKVEA